MDFLYNGEPGWISSVRSNKWRIFAQPAQVGLKTHVWNGEDWCKTEEYHLPTGKPAKMKLIVPEELNGSGNILMIFLPLPCRQTPPEISEMKSQK